MARARTGPAGARARYLPPYIPYTKHTIHTEGRAGSGRRVRLSASASWGAFEECPRLGLCVHFDCPTILIIVSTHPVTVCMYVLLPVTAGAVIFTMSLWLFALTPGSHCGLTSSSWARFVGGRVLCPPFCPELCFLSILKLRHHHLT